jgi:nucleoid-associated protein YgaU
MGLIDFVKNAGARIFGFGDDEPEVEKVDPAVVKRQQEKAKAEALIKHVEAHGFEVENLTVYVNDTVATVHGKVSNQADREKIVLTIGNVDGVSRVDDRMEVVTPEPEAVYYTVVRGDTLSKIAKEQYGNAMKYPVIFEANRPMLKDPDKIYPGQVLRIPPIE